MIWSTLTLTWVSSLLTVLEDSLHLIWMLSTLSLNGFSTQTIITLNPTSSSEFISYIRNLKKDKLPSFSCICSIPYIFKLTSIFFLISNCMQNFCMFLHCWKNSLFIFPNQGKIDKPLLALDLFIIYLAYVRYITYYVRSIWKKLLLAIPLFFPSCLV